MVLLPIVVTCILRSKMFNSGGLTSCEWHISNKFYVDTSCLFVNSSNGYLMTTYQTKDATKLPIINSIMVNNLKLYHEGKDYRDF